jgi:hypothetical protein
MDKTFKVNIADKPWKIRLKTLVNFGKWTLAFISVERVQDEKQRSGSNIAKGQSA